jgi:hypothetical protein
LQKAALLLIEIERSNGCSLKIHRVESALSAESRKLHRAAGDKNLIASKRTNLFVQVMTNSSPGRNTEERFTLRHNARERPRKSRQMAEMFRKRRQSYRVK